jgi:hypothetical protein
VRAGPRMPAPDGFGEDLRRTGDGRGGTPGRARRGGWRSRPWGGAHPPPSRMPERSEEDAARASAWARRGRGRRKRNACAVRSVLSW